jgi:methylenetetrahydrofolate dehydrogenase (NADP+)/methenyltetrahydrofolate cyclohydrolase
MIIDGKQIAASVLEEAARIASELGREVRLAALSGDASPATASYLKIKQAQAAKAGIRMDVVPLPPEADTHACIEAVLETADRYDAVIVQLPLPEGVETERILDAIPAGKDADLLSHLSRAHFEAGDEDSLLPPVVDAVREILMRSAIDPGGKDAVVIGQGWLVGAPAAAWLAARGARVSVLTTGTPPEEFAAALAKADIVVSGAGKPGIIRPDQVKEGVVLMDAGTSESGGAIVGDADPAAAERAAVFTPVPGGVGPIAVACLFRNAARLARGSNEG